MGITKSLAGQNINQQQIKTPKPSQLFESCNFTEGQIIVTT